VVGGYSLDRVAQAFPGLCGACHRAALGADPLAPTRWLHPGYALWRIYILTVHSPYLILRVIPAHQRASSRDDPEAEQGVASRGCGS